jgi:hypothetical protein
VRLQTLAESRQAITAINNDTRPYIVGDATRDVQFAIVAAAEAAEAACAINKGVVESR